MSEYFAEYDYADARAEYMYVNQAAVSQMESHAEITRARGFNTFYSKTRVGGSLYDITVTTLTDGIDTPNIQKGAMPESGEIIIDSIFSEAHGVRVGDTLSFDVATLKNIELSITDGSVRYIPEYVNVNYAFTVGGIYHSPDVIYKVNVLNTSANADEFAMAYINYADVSAYLPNATVTLGGNPVFSYAQIPEGMNVYTGVRVLGKGDIIPVFEKYSVSTQEDLFEIFGNPDKPAGLFMYGTDRDGFAAVSAYDAINDTIAALAAVLPLIFFIVAAVITVISLSKTVESQRTQIGVIQGLGISKGAVYFSYIFYALFACVIGGFSGGIVGTYTVPHLLRYIYARQFALPPTALSINFAYTVYGVLIAAAVSALAAFLSCYRTLKVCPAQAMRAKPPKKTRRILVERWSGFWNRLGFGAKMNLRNMFLHKLRMLCSSFGIIGCLALLIGLIGLKDNMQMSFVRYEKSVGYDMTLVTDTAVDITTFDFDEASGYDGAQYIQGLTFVPSFSGRLSANGKSADMTVMALPTPSEAQLFDYADSDCVKMFSDLDYKTRLELRDDTFAIPTTLADKLGVKAGDTVNVSGYSQDNRTVNFDITVSNLIYEFFEQKAYCSYGTFEDRGVGLYANTSYAKVKDGVDGKTAADALEKFNGVRAVRSYKESLAALKKQMQLLDYAVVFFMIGAAALCIAVIYNITATNLKDRTREMATLMVLGYKQHETVAMVLVENMVITLIGCILGLPLGYGLMRWLVAITSSFNVFISGVLSWYVAIGCIALTFVFSVLATLLLSSRIKKISMVEALKSVE